MANLKTLLSRAAFVVGSNSAEILTGLSLAGVVATGIASGEARLKADDILIQLESEHPDEPLTTSEKAKATWWCYILPVTLGVLTMGCVIGSHKIQGRKLAALASAYSITDGMFKEYRDKVREKFGDKKADEIQHDIDQDKTSEMTMLDKDILTTNYGDVLCLDAWSGQKFFSNAEAIRQAKDRVNAIMLDDMYVDLNTFYDELGIPPTEAGDDTGWNALADKTISVKFSSTLDKEKIPCLVMHIHPSPRPLYREI